MRPEQGLARARLRRRNGTDQVPFQSLDGLVERLVESNEKRAVRPVFSYFLAERVSLIELTSPSLMRFHRPRFS